MENIIETGTKTIKKNSRRKKDSLSLDFRSNLDPALTIMPSPIQITMDEPAEPAKKNEEVAKKTRYPQGTRKHRKTDECIVIKDKAETKDADKAETKDADKAEKKDADKAEKKGEDKAETKGEDKAETKGEDKPIKKTRCPQGTRKHRKTGECIPIKEKTALEGDAAATIPRKKQNVAAMPIPVVEPADTASNTELFAAEKREYDQNTTEVSTYDFLYPDLNDPRFNEKIAQHKEFADTQYDGAIHDVKKQAEIMCNSRFELMPHQIFVKNFMSLQTPYNSLLLYHGLGSGKTLSSIGIAEEMRAYMKQMNITQRIIVVASPNVQANYKLQLFDERKLRLVAGSENMGDAVWAMDNSIGNSLLKEINPTNLKGLSREKIITSVRRIINQYYLFIGYGQLSNYIYNAIKKNPNYDTMSKDQRKKMFVKYVREQFDNRLLIIDEVHNIRLADDNQERKKTALLLMQVAKYAQNMRMILLSATPLFNSYKEIIWLTNLMNINDKRATIEITDVFDADGYFKPADLSKGVEGGRELLMRKLTGYISYVRGENPYTFPYRIYPDTFAPEHIFAENNDYPQVQMNGNPVEEPIKHIKTYNTTLGIYQAKGYDKIIEDLKEKSYEQYTTSGQVRRMPTFENMESFGYTVLQNPLQALNMVYPSTDEDSVIENMVGKNGLESVMKYVEETQGGIPTRHSFEYKADVLKSYGEIFSENELPKYSAKIAEICSIIKKSTGIVAIYSQYIDGGIVPIALALESMGFGRYCHSTTAKNLFKTAPKSAIDALLMKPKAELEGATWHPAKYAMITGDKALSPSNAADIKYITGADNIHGEKVKVILISKAGAEGLDFKNIRQMHVLEPWYNMNRIEQIVGRAVRTLSHCALPFEERNVEIYLHGSILPDPSIEAADLYVYRLAEKKAQQIGNVTRLLKTIAVDCILNHGQTNFTEENLNTTVELRLSTNGQTVTYAVGDKPHTEICDYMDNCNFTCANSPGTPEVLYNEYYNTQYVESNQEILLARIRELFREKTPKTGLYSKTSPVVAHMFYERDQLIAHINAVKQYPIEQIFSALSRLIHNRNEYLVDAYGRTGRLVDKYHAATDTAYYVFQPVEITDENASIYDRSSPLEFKRSSITLEIDKNVEAAVVAKTDEVAVAPVTDTVGFDAIVKSMENALFDVFHTQVLDKGEKNWYKHAGMVVYYSDPEHIFIETQKTKNPDKTISVKKIEHKLPITQLRTEFGITDEEMFLYMAHHYLDTLDFSHKMAIVRHFYSDKREPDSENEDIIKAYFDRLIVRVGDLMGVVMMKDENLVIMVQNAEGAWTEADQEDYDVLGKELLQWRIPRVADKMNDLLGFITLFVSKKSNTKEMVFKVKDMTEKRNNFGARIDDAGKDKVIKLLNKIAAPEVLYDDSNTVFVSQLGLCIMIEILMRAFSDKRRGGKYYYLTPEQTVMSEIIKKSFA